jgi:Tfp pilus assembly protein PilV
MTRRLRPGGFSSIELVLAIAILAAGILSMGASTGRVMAEIHATELRTERMFVVRQATETLRATNWSSLESVCAGELPAFGSGAYAVTCVVARPSADLKWVYVVTTGPGFRGGGLIPSLTETTAISLARPVEPC